MEEFIGKKVKVIVLFSDSTVEGGSIPEVYYGIVEKVKDGFIFLVMNKEKGLIGKKEIITEKKAININYISVITEVYE